MTTIITNNKTVEEFKKCIDLAFKKSIQKEFIINEEQFFIDLKFLIKKNYFFKDKDFSIVRSFTSPDVFHFKTLFYEDNKESLYLMLDFTPRNIESVNLVKKIHDKGISATYDFEDYCEFNRLYVQFDLHNHGHVIYLDNKLNDLFVATQRDEIKYDNVGLKEVNDFGNFFETLSKCSDYQLVVKDISNFMFNNENIKKEKLETFYLLHDIDLKKISKYKDFFIDINKLDYKMLSCKEQKIKKIL